MKSINTFSLLKAMLDIAPKNDVRYYLNGVHVACTDTSKIIIEATCGHSLLRVTLMNLDSDLINIEKTTNVILCRDSITKLIKMFTYKNPPIITLGGDTVNLNGVDDTQLLSVDTIKGRFPDCDRIFRQRTIKNQTSNASGINFDLLSKASKAIGKLVQYGVSTIHDTQGFKFEANTPVGDIVLLVMPCRV